MTSKEALLYLATTDRNSKIGDEAKNILWELVERDSPKKPMLELFAENKFHYVCPICNTIINIGNSIGYNMVFNVFCKKCGQRLEWSDKK